jgi:predicted nucleic acid-binding protein
MSDKIFVDTNVIIYLYSSDEPEKQLAAQELILTDSTWISTQVISEFSNVLRKRFNQDYQSIREAVTELTKSFQVTVITLDMIYNAFMLAERYQYSYYDSLILAAALKTGCSRLYTEDLQDGQLIDSTLTIKNPFKPISQGTS